jgi:flagellar hook assembly protein FlgD
MKTKSTIFALMAVVFGVFTTIASTGKDGKTAKMDIRTSINEDKVFVTYVSDAQVKVEVQIRDEQGRVIASDLVENENGFRRPYNISQLKDGNYIVKMFENKALVYESKFAIDTKKTAVMELGDNKFQLTYKDNHKQDVSINIYDDKGTLLHQEKVEQMAGFSRIYDLSKLNPDHVSFEVSTAKSQKHYKF